MLPPSPNDCYRPMCRSTRSRVAANLGLSLRQPSNVAFAFGGDTLPTTALPSPPGAMRAPGTTRPALMRPPSRRTLDTPKSNAQTAWATTRPRPASAPFTGHVSTPGSSPSFKKPDLQGSEKPAAQDAESRENTGSSTTCRPITRTIPLMKGFTKSPLFCPVCFHTFFTHAFHCI